MNQEVKPTPAQNPAVQKEIRERAAHDAALARELIGKWQALRPALCAFMMDARSGDGRQVSARAMGAKNALDDCAAALTAMIAADDAQAEGGA